VVVAGAEAVAAAVAAVAEVVPGRVLSRQQNTR